MKVKFSTMLLVLLAMITSCKNENVKQEKVLFDKVDSQNSQPAVSGTASNPVATDGKFAVMTFQEEEHDFGTIQQGDKPSTDFSFKNTGEADLIITSARGSCGCTVPDYPKTPIKPGEAGNIKVSFDSRGKQGKTTKTVTIMCNTKEGNKILKINANIEVSKKN
jgi:hypothetical protein